RWTYAATCELSPDEAYYFQWSKRLDWAYFSKGPGVALAIRMGAAIFGENEFGVRFLSPLLALGTSLVMFVFARKLYSEAVAPRHLVAGGGVHAVCLAAVDLESATRVDHDGAHETSRRPRRRLRAEPVARVARVSRRAFRRLLAAHLRRDARRALVVAGKSAR